MMDAVPGVLTVCGHLSLCVLMICICVVVMSPCVRLLFKSQECVRKNEQSVSTLFSTCFLFSAVSHKLFDLSNKVSLHTLGSEANSWV